MEIYRLEDQSCENLPIFNHSQLHLSSEYACAVILSAVVAVVILQDVGLRALSHETL